MVRPRWQGLQTTAAGRFWHRWDQAVALVAAANLAWVLFDVTYVPLRSFWLQRTLYPLPSVSLGIPLPWLPDITPIYDPVKGIEAHRDTAAYIAHFRELEHIAAEQGIDSTAARQRRLEMVVHNSQLIDENPFVSSGNAGTLEKLKNRLRARAGRDSPKQAAAYLLSDSYLNSTNWEQERAFWNRRILPLAATNYWRGINESGLPIDHSWRIDIPFQILFLLDILLRTIRLKRRYPRIRWRDALLRRWIDLPLLLPFWRVLRVVPVTERLSRAGLIQLEPLRAVISRGVVALLALELFEVITVRVVDAAQQVIRSPQLPQRVRSFCSYQSTDLNEQRELVELARLWLPLLLTRVGPNLRPQLVALLGHLLQRSMERSVRPEALRGLPALQRAESELSLQLAGGLVDSLIDVSKGAGGRIGQKDPVLDSLSTQTLDRFWEELARVLDQGPVLERSQELLASLLEDLKRSSFRQLRDQGGVDALISELDGLNFNRATSPTRPQA